MKKCLMKAREVHRSRKEEPDDSDDDLIQEITPVSTNLSVVSTPGTSRSVASVTLMEHSSKQTTMNEFTIRTTKPQNEVLDRKLASFFYACNIPFNIVENKEFIDMVQALRPGYKPPNRKQLGGKLLNEAANDIEDQMKQMLKDSTITLVQDGWSSVTNDSIIASSLATGSKVYLVDAIDTGSNKKTSSFCASIAENTIHKIEEKYDKKVRQLLSKLR